jgi:hypothetical protein
MPAVEQGREELPTIRIVAKRALPLPPSLPS